MASHKNSVGFLERKLHDVWNGKFTGWIDQRIKDDHKGVSNTEHSS